MPQDVHDYVSQCKSCRRQRPSDLHQRLLKLLPPSGTLEPTIIAILGPLKWTKQGNRLIVVITDRYIKLIRAIPISRITVSRVRMVVLEDWIMPCGIPDVFQVHIDRRLISKFFATLWTFLGAKLVTTTN